MRRNGWALAGMAGAALAVAGCGSSDDDASTQAAAGGSTMQAATSGGDMQMSTTAGGMSMQMTQLAKADQGDEEISLSAMTPETFYVSDGTKLRKQAPGPDDKAHMMVTVSDRESGIRLPDATVTLRLTDADGRTVFDGPLYQMIGRGMGLHYGENVPLPQDGRYEATLVVGPSRVGRHQSVQDSWMTTERVKLAFEWNGTQASPAS